MRMLFCGETAFLFWVFVEYAVRSHNAVQLTVDNRRNGRGKFMTALGKRRCREWGRRTAEKYAISLLLLLLLERVKNCLLIKRQKHKKRSAEREEPPNGTTGDFVDRTTSRTATEVPTLTLPPESCCVAGLGP